MQLNNPTELDRPLAGWRLKLYTIIFEADTLAGRRFDQAIIAAILISVGVVVLDSVESLDARWGDWFTTLEWLFTLAFTLEYALRLMCVRRPLVYATSFSGSLTSCPSCRPTWRWWCPRSTC